jgi:hypothetical protein
MNKNSESTEEEEIDEEEKKELYYNEKGDKMAKNQFKNLTKVITGNPAIVLSSDKVQIKRTIGKYTKSEVQTNSKELISEAHKISLERIIIMARAYSGIEQVSSEIEVNEERNNNVEIREAIETLAAIYMHYPIGNRWERIKLFARLEPEYKEVLFSCTMNDHIRNLAKTRSGLVSVIQLVNFKIHMKEESNTIAVSQENYLKDFEGVNCFIEE